MVQDRTFRQLISCISNNTVLFSLLVWHRPTDSDIFRNVLFSSLHYIKFSHPLQLTELKVLSLKAQPIPWHNHSQRFAKKLALFHYTPGYEPQWWSTLAWLTRLRWLEFSGSSARREQSEFNFLALRTRKPEHHLRPPSSSSPQAVCCCWLLHLSGGGFSCCELLGSSYWLVRFHPFSFFFWLSEKWEWCVNK